MAFCFISQIPRACNPSKFLQPSAQILLKTLVKMLALSKNNGIFVNHAFLRRFTKATSSRQNQRILKQLSNLLEIKYYNSYTLQSTKKYFGYAIKFKNQEIANYLLKLIRLSNNLNFKSQKLNISTRKKKNLSTKTFFTKHKMSTTQYIYNIYNIYNTNNKYFDFLDLSKKENNNTADQLVIEKESKLTLEVVLMIKKYTMSMTSIKNSGRKISVNQKLELYKQLICHVTDWKPTKIIYFTLVERAKIALNIAWSKFKQGIFRIPFSYQKAKILDINSIQQNGDFCSKVKENSVFDVEFLKESFKITRMI